MISHGSWSYHARCSLWWISLPWTNDTRKEWDARLLHTRYVKTNVTTQEFLPHQKGDLTIIYDVTRTYDSSCWAQFTISNHNPLGRLDYWKLCWNLMKDEFIYSMSLWAPSLMHIWYYSSFLVDFMEGEKQPPLERKEEALWLWFWTYNTCCYVLVQVYIFL